jgi:hypothetical protein
MEDHAVRASLRVRAGMVAVLTLLTVSGCVRCEGVAIDFPDHPVIVGGTWTGVAASSQRPDVALLLDLDVTFVSSQSYAVSGTLELGDGTRLAVDGAGYGFCEQRFVVAAAPVRATPAPEMPRFEATLRDAAGERVGRIVAFRFDDGGGSAMEGQFWIDVDGAERSYAFEADRL